MTEFCNDCPQRGSACGELTGIAYEEFSHRGKYNFTWEKGFYGVLVDIAGHSSELLKLPDYPRDRNFVQNMDTLNRYVLGKVELCEQPASKRLCQAIGDMALNARYKLPSSLRRTYQLRLENRQKRGLR